MAAPVLAPHPVDDFVAELKHRVRDVRADAMTRALYATDGSMYQQMPLAVVLPRNEEEVQATIELAHRFNLPLLPRGAGSSLAGQTVNAAVVLDFARYMNKVLDFNPETRRIRVQPGMVVDQLNAYLSPHGLTLGPDPASSSRATLGGMVGNNATGTHSLLFGNTDRHVHALKVLLQEGTTLNLGQTSSDMLRQLAQRSGREGQVFAGYQDLLQNHAEVIRRDTARHWRRASGYRLEHLLAEEPNLARLLVGSEGSLAVTTEIELDLVVKPKKTMLGLVHFHSLDASLRATPYILETNPAAIELFDGFAIRAAQASAGFRDRMKFVVGQPEALLITEYFGDSEEELLARLDHLEAHLARSGQGYAVVRATTPAQVASVWSVRKEGLGLIMSAKGEFKPIAFIEDASVPVEDLADYIAQLLDFLKETNTPVALYAHASAGTLHVRPFINTKDKAEVRKMEQIARRSMELVRSYSGTVSSEHGDGRARSWLNPELLGPELYAANVRLKNAFDPDNKMNPGMVVESPPMTEQLRLGPGYETIPLLTEMDWSSEGSFADAVEMCNGNGACRKLQSGVMCPSYMATLEEEHSTRGRANALRMAMSGELGEDAFTSKRLYEVMELCVQCKGCKTECPSNVDMGKMKTEWLGKYYEKNGVPIRSRFFGMMPVVTRRITGKRAKVVNWVNRQKPIRALMDKAMGISSRRELPAFAEEPFTDWFPKQTWRKDGPGVVLFADTFTNYNHPEIARAAAELFDRAGFAVQVASPKACCGRPMLSKGLLKEARAQALNALSELLPLAQAGLPIVGFEPSCVLTFRDEFKSLLPNDPRVDVLAKQSYLFENFVAEHAERFAALKWKSGKRTVLLHGHCHQKALVGTDGALAALRMPGYDVSLIESSCCGMAGAFGYESEHVDVSLKMAELKLAPAVRKAAPDTLIAAAGTSCRHQIHDTTGRHPLHPAQILRDALA